VAHVGVQRLGAREREHDRADGREDERPRSSRNSIALSGLSAARIAGACDDLAAARSRASTTNQSTSTGPNSLPTTAVPMALHDEQAHEHADRDRQHVGVKRRRDDLEALDRAQHGDRRRDHAVAVEQRRAEEPEQQQDARRRWAPRPAPRAR
jgi:hypothetical protein